MTSAVRVMIVDEHELFRDGLHTFIGSLSGYRITASADSVRQACTLLLRDTFDLVISDLWLSGTTGLALVRELRRLRRPEKIMLLTVSKDVHVAAECFSEGAAGYVLKSDPRQVLIDGIEQVTRGQRFISPGLGAAEVEQLVQRRLGTVLPGPLASLSVREREVFALLVRGFSNTAAGKELCISIKTVETHRAHIMAKLDLHSLADLVRFAFTHQLVPWVPPTNEFEPQRETG